MSNATALMIEFVVWKTQAQAGGETGEEAGGEAEREVATREASREVEGGLTSRAEDSRAGRSRGGEGESQDAGRQETRRKLGKRTVEVTAVEGSGSGSGKVERSRWNLQGAHSSSRTVAQAADAAVSAAVRSWETGCIVCRANGRSTLEHAWESCSVDADDTEAVRKGVELMGELKKTPLKGQGFRCWARGEGCRCRAEGKQGGCSGSPVIQRAVGALLFAKQRPEARR